MSITVKKLPSRFIKQGFVRGDSAVDKNEVAVSPDSPDAVKWCMRGAIEAAGLPNCWDAVGLLGDICEGQFGTRVANTNDSLVTKWGAYQLLKILEESLDIREDL